LGPPVKRVVVLGAIANYAGGGDLGSSREMMTSSTTTTKREDAPETPRRPGRGFSCSRHDDSGSLLPGAGEAMDRIRRQTVCPATRFEVVARRGHTRIAVVQEEFVAQLGL